MNARESRSFGETAPSFHARRTASSYTRLATGALSSTSAPSPDIVRLKSKPRRCSFIWLQTSSAKAAMRCSRPGSRVLIVAFRIHPMSFDMSPPSRPVRE